jgi:hypothetical protein
MCGHEHGDCGYDYNRSWDYNECRRPRRSARRERRLTQNSWQSDSWV